MGDGYMCGRNVKMKESLSHFCGISFLPKWDFFFCGLHFFCFYLSIYVFLQIMDSPLVLSMCDTLLQRSEESGDKHMQIISYCIKLDYFYYKNDEENILKQTDEVKKVCLRLDNLKYYYFAWGGRLITYY